MDSGQQQSPAQCSLSNMGKSVMALAIGSIVMNIYAQGFKQAENAKNHNYIIK